MTLTYIDFSLLVLLMGFIQFLLSIWIKLSLENSIKYKYDQLLEEHKRKLDIKDKASKAAEYIAIRTAIIQEENPKIDTIKANQLAFELALWLPDNLYLDLQQLKGEKGEVTEKNIFETLIKIRKFLGKEETKLTEADIFFIRPN